MTLIRPKKYARVTSTKQQISQILEEVNRIGKEKGTEIEEIKAGEIQISTNELALKEIILKGNEHYYKGEYLGALRVYEKAIQIDANHAGAWNNKGIALDELAKYNEAVECYDKAIQIDPNYAIAWSNKGSALYSLRKRNEAVEAFDKAIEINPNNAQAWNNKAWNNKGNVLGNLGKYNEAIEVMIKL